MFTTYQSKDGVVSYAVSCLNEDFEKLEDVLEEMRSLSHGMEYSASWLDDYDPSNWAVRVPEAVMDDLRLSLCDVSGSLFALIQMLASFEEA